jgi:pimeloyl-ACP methyl ester carboxylesterase
MTMTVETSRGRAAYRDSEGRGVPVVMIHGNLNSGGIFRNQPEGALGRTYRIIAPDLLGHRHSSDAVDPARTYNMPG